MARGVQVLDGGTIEDDGAADLQVDFANAFLGGGVLGAGCVQVNAFGTPSISARVRHISPALLPLFRRPAPAVP